LIEKEERSRFVALKVYTKREANRFAVPYVSYLDAVEIVSLYYIVKENVDATE
jgi:hypothetical protein